MSRISWTCVAALIAAASTSATAVEMTAEESAYLRERADALIAERERNPHWDGGISRLASRSDVPLDRQQGDVRHTHRGDVKVVPKGKRKVKREPVRKKLKRVVKTIPGALLRD